MATSADTPQIADSTIAICNSRSSRRGSERKAVGTRSLDLLFILSAPRITRQHSQWNAAPTYPPRPSCVRLVPPPCSPLKCPDNRQPGKARRADDCKGVEGYAGRFLRSAERQHSHARRCLVDREQRATLDVVPVRFEGVNDGADDLVREKVLSSDLDDARRRPSGRGEDCGEVEVRDDDEAVLVRPRQDFVCGAVAAPIVDQWTASNP